MCGIVASVGTPKDPKKLGDLLTNLMAGSQQRGQDATGFYGVFSQKDDEDIIAHFRLDVMARRFLDLKQWKDYAFQGPKLFIGHVRHASPGSGIPSQLDNNHPHIGNDGRLALVHNGRYRAYTNLKTQYAKVLKGQCDSEIMLRIIEEEVNGEDGSVVNGITAVFDKGQDGAYAMAIAEYDENEQNDDAECFLHVASDKGVYRLFMTDLRESLGCYIFTSTEEILRAAARKSDIDLNGVEITEVEPYHVLSIRSSDLEISKHELPVPATYVVTDPFEDGTMPTQATTGQTNATNVNNGCATSSCATTSRSPRPRHNVGAKYNQRSLNLISARKKLLRSIEEVRQSLDDMDTFRNFSNDIAVIDEFAIGLHELGYLMKKEIDAAKEPDDDGDDETKQIADQEEAAATVTS